MSSFLEKLFSPLRRRPLQIQCAQSFSSNEVGSSNASSETCGDRVEFVHELPVICPKECKPQSTARRKSFPRVPTISLSTHAERRTIYRYGVFSCRPILFGIIQNVCVVNQLLSASEYEMNKPQDSLFWWLQKTVF